MNYEYELNFFCDVLKKCHIHTDIISTLDPAESIMDSQLASIIGFKSDFTVGQVLGIIENKTKYKLSDEFNFRCRKGYAVRHRVCSCGIRAQALY